MPKKIMVDGSKHLRHAVNHFAVNTSLDYTLDLAFCRYTTMNGVLNKIMQKWILSGILIVYFVFTSGLVFELTKSESTDKLETPYSSRLSSPTH